MHSTSYYFYYCWPVSNFTELHALTQATTLDYSILVLCTNHSVTAVHKAYRDSGRVGHKFQFGEHPDVVGELERGVKKLLGLSGHVNWSPSNGEDIDCLQLLLHLVCRSVVQYLTINTQSHNHVVYDGTIPHPLTHSHTTTFVFSMVKWTTLFNHTPPQRLERKRLSHDRYTPF